MAAPWYETALGGFARACSRIRPWHRWPFLISLPILIGVRTNMRHANLFDCETAPEPDPPQPSGDYRNRRTADGSYNDLAHPRMGMAGARFGRNVPLAHGFPEAMPQLMEPNPREISNRLLKRETFQPVPHLNVLVPAWLQCMVHDWLSHGENERGPVFDVPLPDGDDWPDPRMTILKTLPDGVRAGDAGRPPAYTNVETAWWDGSQVYGSDLKRQLRVRTNADTGQLLPDGKLWLTGDGLLPVEREAKIEGLELAGVNGNWWVGLSVIQTLMAREHNAIVDRLKIDYPAADGEWLFQTARLALSALMAKIHTTEWTPALMGSAIGQFVMRGNWWGVMGEHHARGYGRYGSGEVLFGVMGSPTDHHAAPYSMTEDFTACYRMHPLIPDEFSFRRAVDDEELLSTDLLGVFRGMVSKLYQQVPFNDVLYSLGTSHPGALALHNYPESLRRMPPKRESDVWSDLAATDILRDRERGVPRYCAFRRHLGMSAPRTFAQLTDDKQWQRELEDMYGDVEKVDLLVGTLAESKCKRNGTPVGFGFSDTVFRVFIVMASRRLKSDRFYTSDFNERVYTPAGFGWVRDNSMRTVLERHAPELTPHFADARNVFFPWKRGPV
jgi:hypothetical protein